VLVLRLTDLLCAVCCVRQGGVGVEEDLMSQLTQLLTMVEHEAQQRQVPLFQKGDEGPISLVLRPRVSVCVL
jgi:hypothetical protein